MNREDLSRARTLLCRLQDSIRDRVIEARDSGRPLSGLVSVTAADAVYQVDEIGEAAVLEWFSREWPPEWPVELVTEGLEAVTTFPDGTAVERCTWKCILDPIDGTRNIMYDKRPAWVLGALAPHRGAATSLRDIAVCALTEIPTSKQCRSDQISGFRGRGRSGLRSEMLDLRTRERTPSDPRPTQARDLRHGFAQFARFFPEGKALTAALEERLCDELYGLGHSRAPLVFEDQYVSTGGQIYELLVGHDRMAGDLRPLVLGKLGYDQAVRCHPYDICCGMLLQEAGGVLETPFAEPLDQVLDTTTPVAWVGYANEMLAEHVRPVLQKLVREMLA